MNNAFIPLPLGSVKPLGWLADQLRIQADGLSGHLDEFWPDIARSKWIGGDAEGWERGPYWLDGVVPLAVLLDDARLKDKIACWLDYILAHQHSDGWFGPIEDRHVGSGEQTLDPWPQFILFKAMTQWQESTGDERIVPALLRALRRMDALLAEKPLENWARMRWPDLVLSIHWLHERTGEPWLLDLARTAQAQGYDWHAHFTDFRYTEKQPQWTLENHVVNHAMALKEPAVRLGDAADRRDLPAHYIEVMDTFHGQATGVFTGDESLAGKNPSQGTELCAVVEYMFSLETLLSAFGEAAFGDRLERIAYNALPATFTPDMWAHQYDQQANQVVCKIAPDGERIYTNNSEDANLFGLEPCFGCCTANMHQGWPKLVASLWMAAPDGGLAAAAYGPCVVRATVADGVDVTITEETEYPFRDSIRLTINAEQPVRFPLHLRVPGWAAGASVQYGERTETPATGTFHTIERVWNPGDTLTLCFPMDEIRLERGCNESVSVHRGPLVFSLKIGEEFRYLRGEKPHADWEVHPTTVWNYGLALDTRPLREQFSVRQTPVDAVPFAPDAAPVILTAAARRVPQWTVENNAAGPPPSRPVQTREPVEAVDLVPYGSTHLRVTEFPVVAAH